MSTEPKFQVGETVKIQYVRGYRIDVAGALNASQKRLLDKGVEDALGEAGLQKGSKATVTKVYPDGSVELDGQVDIPQECLTHDLR